MRKEEETLVLGREDLIKTSENKQLFLIDLQDFRGSSSPLRKNKIVIFIDNNGETKILKNTYGNDDSEYISRGMMNWIKFSELQPKSKQKVYILLENERGNLFQTMAIYIPKRTVLAENFIDEDSDFYEYDNEGEAWTPEGFYEWNYSSEINMHISEKVIYWHPLFNIENLKNK